MKPILTVFASLLFLLAFSQNANLKFTKDETSKNVREFRKTLISTEKTDAQKQLLENISAVLSFVKSTDDTEKLNLLNAYFDQAAEVYNTSSENDRKEIVKTVNTDLANKLFLKDSTVSGHLGNSGIAFKLCRLNIEVYVNNIKQNAAGYRVCWAYNFGVSAENIIRANRYNGSYLNLNPPLQIDVPLPGYITFWMIYQNKTYTTDLPFYTLSPNDLQISLNFKELN